MRELIVSYIFELNAVACWIISRSDGSLIFPVFVSFSPTL